MRARGALYAEETLSKEEAFFAGKCHVSVIVVLLYSMVMVVLPALMKTFWMLLWILLVLTTGM